MKKVLVAVLVCVASTFAAWDYFPVIGEDKGEAKLAYYQGRKGYGGWRSNEFKIRYSPMANLEVMSKYNGSSNYHENGNHVLGARYQVMPNVSAGLDLGLPLPNPFWVFTPNAQFSMPLTDALQLGTTAELIIPGEDPTIGNGYTDVMYFKIGAEVDFNLEKNIAWIKLDLSSGFGEDSEKRKASDYGKGLKMSPAVGYIANVGNMALGTSLGMDLGEKSGNSPRNTIIAVDAAFKF